MQYRQSLKQRITLSFVVFGAVLSTVISSGVNLALEDIETAVIEDSLRGEVLHFEKSLDKKLNSFEQVGADLTRYYYANDQLSQLPPNLQALTPGYHEVEVDEHPHYVMVVRNKDVSLYMIKDAAVFETREDTIKLSLVISVFASILIAMWLGRSLAGRVISPVAQLAMQLTLLTPKQERRNLSEQYADDEVGQLARTFELYLQKIEQFIEREQAFTANASHELRTPLAVINGAAELLLETPELPDRSVQQIQRIARAGERMSQMLEVLLVLARETSSEREESEENCLLQEIVIDVIEQHRHMVEGRDISLQSSIVSPLKLKISRNALTIVLNNLVRNAINHTHEGRVSVLLDATGVTVVDTGQGIADEELEKIFNRHYRGKNTANIGGSGIGLSIVKRICDRMGWRITIHSEIGKGTEARLSLLTSESGD